jgi:hypothetical protein
MLKRKWFGLKYIDSFTHHVDSLTAPARRKMFDKSTDTKHGKVSNKASGGMKTNIFQRGRAGCEAKIHMNGKKRIIKIMSPF